MKVAVLSAVATSGKTTLMTVLGGVFSRSQGRDVAVFSTGDARDNIEMVTVLDHNEKLDNPYIFKSMVETASDDGKELLYYGAQAGDEHVYIYDIMGTAMDQSEKQELLLTAIDKVPADLKLIEICGNPASPLNSQVLKNCDCSIILCGTANKDLRKFVSMIETLPKCKAMVNRAICIASYNPVICSDKAFASKLKLKSQDIFKFPYNNQVQKLAFNGELDKVAYNVIIGDNEVVNLRRPCQDLMEYLFDSSNRKVIRSIDRWYR